MALSSVDRLTITFLVDNSIEWFYKLPPGFSSELRSHLADDPPIDPKTGIPIIELDDFCCGAHGFSALIETEVEGKPPHLTLFDTGPDSKSLVRNVAAMNVPVSRIDRVILSHWHRDHTGGLLSLLKLRSSERTAHPPESGIIVDTHPDRPIARGIAPNDDQIIGQLPADPTFELIEEAGGKVEFHREGHAVADGAIWVSGEIPRLTDFEQGILGGVRFFEDDTGKGKWVRENHIMDERYAAIDVKGKGLVIFSACSHAGIVNVVKDVIKTFQKPIHMIIGGLHLGGPELEPRIAPTVEFLSKTMIPAPTYILPMHCSGFLAKVALQKALGEGCVPAGVGIKVNIQGSVTDPRFLVPPSSGE